jgi:hypothetical protein
LFLVCSLFLPLLFLPVDVLLNELLELKLESILLIELPLPNEPKELSSLLVG